MQRTPSYHIPVLVGEVIEFLAIKPSGVYVDATLGGGGHTRAILQANPTVRVIGIDWDLEAIERNGMVLKEEFGDRFEPVWGNFSRIDFLLKKIGVSQVDGILADFGTSQFQLKQAAGFSFYNDTPLDMRMSPAHQQATAAEVLNKASESVLADIFFNYGQERRARTFARLIVAARQQAPFIKTRQLAELIEGAAGWQKTGLHPATKVFQALRIYVNRELDNIRSFLPAAVRLMKEKSRIACITFHSLEDVLVKQFFKDQELQNVLDIITPKGVVAGVEEVRINPAARSARLRVAEYCKKSGK